MLRERELECFTKSLVISQLYTKREEYIMSRHCVTVENKVWLDRKGWKGKGQVMNWIKLEGDRYDELSEYDCEGLGVQTFARSCGTLALPYWENNCQEL
ncbi:hypothetical protein Btru_048413 [Bulinus truncatus]|nr:hypothetical protein Btru_048413 [Bulinus truncatus]